MALGGLIPGIWEGDREDGVTFRARGAFPAMSCPEYLGNHQNVRRNRRHRNSRRSLTRFYVGVGTANPLVGILGPRNIVWKWDLCHSLEG
jgi:hypothetical protein